MGNRHSDIAKVVVNCLPCQSPFRGRCCCPASQVRLYPLSPLIVVTFVRLVRIFRTPVYLRYHDRFRLYHRHLTFEVADESIVIAILIGHISIPPRINMYCIREVVLAIGDRILDVILVLTLITCARNPDDSLEALLANHIHHRLEVIMQSLFWIRSV